ncbi:MAG: aminoacyl-tRNA hydrolase [Chitinophagaceae bacterium]|nr:aminoacyl-tRNA hydrolase [Chitinophagaceae bacterium]
MKYLIAGLGNPETRYADTRHNIGFIVLDNLADQFKISFQPDTHVWKSSCSINEKTVVLIKPTTYMNLSGRAIRYWISHENISFENLLVIADDIFLPFGKIRIKPKGSNGGHNGLKSIEETIQTQNYPRLRFGIGSNYKKGEQALYVLSSFTYEEKVLLREKVDTSCKMIHSFITFGIERTMSFFNQ